MYNVLVHVELLSTINVLCVLLWCDCHNCNKFPCMFKHTGHIIMNLCIVFSVAWVSPTCVSTASIKTNLPLQWKICIMRFSGPMITMITLQLIVSLQSMVTTIATLLHSQSKSRNQW